MEDYHWKPPTEAELKVLEARRERMDKISGIMGDYLLKGYKMLSDICDVCSTILLEDRQRNKYCIACSEVDTMENVKDNPVLSDVAAQRLVEECQGSCEMTAPSHSSTLSEEIPPTHPPPPLVPRRATTLISGNVATACNTASATTTSCMVEPPLPPELRTSQQQMVVENSATASQESAQRDFAAAVQAVQGKMVWATQELKLSSSVEMSIQMCNLIKTCAQAITALNDLRAVDTEPECVRQGRCE